MQNFSELDTTIYLANMSAKRFWAQGRGKNRELIINRCKKELLEVNLFRRETS